LRKGGSTHKARLSFQGPLNGNPEPRVGLATDGKNLLGGPAIKMVWEHGGADFQSRFDKSTGHRLSIIILRERLENFRHGEAIMSAAGYRATTINSQIPNFGFYAGPGR